MSANDSIVGKTVAKFESSDEDIEITFSDGSKLNVWSHVCIHLDHEPGKDGEG